MADNPLRILLLEDNVGDALLLNELLEGSPFSWVVKTTDRLARAIAILQEEPFDLVMMDLSLPDSTGGETLRRILETEPGLPVIVLSGTTSELSREELLQAGARDFMRKGQLDPEMLWATIQIITGRE